MRLNRKVMDEGRSSRVARFVQFNTSLQESLARSPGLHTVLGIVTVSQASCGRFCQRCISHVHDVHEHVPHNFCWNDWMSASIILEHFSKAFSGIRPTGSLDTGIA